MGACPSRVTDLAYKPLWGLEVRPGFKARARWHKAIRTVIRRLRLRRIIAAAFAGLARDGTLFDRVERKNGALVYRKIHNEIRTVESAAAVGARRGGRAYAYA